MSSREDNPEKKRAIIKSRVWRDLIHFIIPRVSFPSFNCCFYFFSSLIFLIFLLIFSTFSLLIFSIFSLLKCVGWPSN